MSAFPQPLTITLTGGRGRLAQVAHAHFQAAGHHVQSVSRSESDDHHAIGDLFTTPLLEHSDTLLHLAWSSLPITSEKQIGLEWDEDIPLLIRLLNRITEFPPEIRPHFVFFSSGGTVYGSAQNETPSQEGDVCAPIGWYGHGKLAAENIIREFGRRHELTYTILRVSNPYGYPVPHYKTQGIIPFLIESAMAGRIFSVWGDGSARKDFIHHSDFMQALEAVIQQRLGGTFNLCHGTSHTINEVIALAEKVTGRRIQTQHQPAHAWDVHDSLLDNAKLKSATQWEPQVSLAEGMKLAAATLLSRNE